MVPDRFFAGGCAEFWGCTCRGRDHVQGRTAKLSGLWPSRAGYIPQAFLAGYFVGLRYLFTHDLSTEIARRCFVRGARTAWASFDYVCFFVGSSLPVARIR